VSISDERLVQLQFEVSAIKPSRRISMSSADRVDLLSIFSELQSFRAAAKVRANSEGDGIRDDNFAERLREKMQRGGVTLRDLEAATGVSRSAISRAINGKPVWQGSFVALWNWLASIPATGGEKV
jgi:hypothetical protein